MLTAILETLVITVACIAGYYIATAPSRKGK
jgi:hypothetical protein